MVYSVFAEDDDLFAIFHPTLWILTHTVYKHLVIEIFPQFGDIYYVTVGKLLEFGMAVICGLGLLSHYDCNGSGASMKESLVAADVTEHHMVYLRWRV